MISLSLRTVPSPPRGPREPQLVSSDDQRPSLTLSGPHLDTTHPLGLHRPPAQNCTSSDEPPSRWTLPVLTLSPEHQRELTKRDQEAVTQPSSLLWGEAGEAKDQDLLCLLSDFTGLVPNLL